MARKAPLESLRLLWQHSPDSMFIIHVRDGHFYLADFNPEQERAFPPEFDLSKPQVASDPAVQFFKDLLYISMAKIIQPTPDFRC